MSDGKSENSKIKTVKVIKVGGSNKSVVVKGVSTEKNTEAKKTVTKKASTKSSNSKTNVSYTTSLENVANLSKGDRVKSYV